MIKQTKISIIVPVYNSEKHLKECIDSILEQTIKDFELILVDDGSTDNSPSICDSYQKDSRVKVIHKENSGPSQTRNVGIDLATGEYIGFVDSDDFIEKNMYLTLYNKAIKENCDIAFCDFLTYTHGKTTLVKTDLNENRVYNSNEIKSTILPYFFGYADNETKNYKCFFPFADYASYIFIAIYKTSMVHDNNIKFYDQKLYFNEDNLFNLEAVNKSSKMAHVSKPLYFYRDGEVSLSNKFSEDFKNAKIRRYSFLQDFIKSNKLDPNYQRRLENKICIESINIINYYVNQGSLKFKGKMRYIKEIVNENIIKESLLNFNFKELSFSKLSIFLWFEKKRQVLILYLLSKAYNLIRK